MKKLINIKNIFYLAAIAAIAAIFQACVVYSPYSQQPQVTVPDIVRMSKDGLSSKDIISQIRQSHTAYSLKADQLVQLRDQGVQDSVINYMEETHLNSVRRDQRMYDSYNGYGYGWDGFGYWGGIGFGWPYYGWNWGPTIIFRGSRGFGSYHGGGFHGGFHNGGGGFHGGSRGR